MTPSAFATYLETQRRTIERALRQQLPARSADPLDRAVRHALLGGGKRLRPILTLAACACVKGRDERALPYACAIEMIHAYSLVHDDLPAMDDDDLRRGRPTTHIVFGEAMAVLAGDALLTDAFSVAASPPAAIGLSPKKVLALVRELAEAAGSRGMVRGQARDMDVSRNRESIATLETTHRRKTGDLIRCAVRLGAIAGGASPGNLAKLTRYAESMGLAFQIVDDLLDVLGSTEETGKRVRRDAAMAKATFPALMGEEAARARAAELVHDALGALASFDDGAAPLRALVRYTTERIPPARTAGEHRARSRHGV